ncbi:MAG: CNNM domain-containing protein [Planctomycetota bacterium]
MELLFAFAPHLTAMAALAAASGVFSCSEAALFYLGREDREQMRRGARGERAAVALLAQPDRLLTAILFWNLAINMAYFSLASMVALGVRRAGGAGGATAVSLGALMLMIVVSEMLPKNFGVLLSRRLAALLGLPLAAATRLVDPLLPTLQAVSNACGRLVAPRFTSEPYMELTDLERAITLSGKDPTLVEQEQHILSRIVALAETPVEEVMRPRKHYLAFTPPVTSADLDGQPTPSGYLLITERDSEEIAAALPLERAAILPIGQRLDYHAAAVALVPWSATAAAVLSEMRRLGRRVAAVLNEMGETIGIVTVEDLLGQVLHPEPAARHPRDRPGRLVAVGGGAWQATGRTTLRRIAKQLEVELPATKSVTLGGLMQEQLHRVPAAGDSLLWGGFVWRVAPQQDSAGMVIDFRPAPAGGPPENSQAEPPGPTPDSKAEAGEHPRPEAQEQSPAAHTYTDTDAKTEADAPAADTNPPPEGRP